MGHGPPIDQLQGVVMSDTLDAALRYLQAGFSLFPLGYRSKHPQFNALPRNESDKASWKQYSHLAPTEDEVTAWFEYNRLNIALIMGQVSKQVIALDFDVIDAYDAWLDKFPEIGAGTATATTGKGMHVLFSLPLPMPRNWKIMMDGVHIGEIRGEGGYIAVWPSIHPSGAQYEWIRPPWNGIMTIDSLADIGISRFVETAPGQAEAKIRPKLGAETAVAQGENGPKNGRHPLPRRTLDFMASGAISVSSQGMNEELYHAAIQHAAAGYSEPDTVAALTPVAERFYVGTGNGNTTEQALRTIQSGWQGGQGKTPIILGPKPSAQPGHYGPKELGPSHRASSDREDLSPKDQFQPRYVFEARQMVYITYRKDGDGFAEVRNYIPFWGRVTKKLTLFEENGEQKVIYTLAGQKDKRPYTLDVEATDFADGRKLYTQLLDYLPGGPPVLAQKLIPHVSTAISAISELKEITEVNAIPSTGWTPDGDAFVMPNGSIGQSNYLCHLSQELNTEFQHFGFRQNSPEENQVALDALFALGSVFRPSSLHVTLSHAFLPPLLRWLGNEARYLLHLHADTGSFKTELAKLIMSLYGPVGDVSITYKWSGTAYGAEARAHVLKDCLMLVDDLKPSTITPDMLPKWIAFIQAAVDAMGRKRATITGRAASALPPRALLFSTGEAIPEAGESSYNARMLLAELDNQPPGRNELLDDIKSKSSLFSGLMGGYVEWLLKGNGHEALSIFKGFQAESIKSAHARLSNNYAANCAGGTMFWRFCEDVGLMDSGLVGSLLSTVKESALEVVGATGRKVQEERYSQKFLSALQDALSTGFCYISNVKPDPKRVGWQDDEYVYLTNGTLAIVNQWLRSSGEPSINIPTKEIRKQLFNDGLTYSSEARCNAGQFDIQRTDPADNSKPMVTAVYRDKFYNTEFSKEGNVA